MFYKKKDMSNMVRLGSANQVKKKGKAPQM